MRSPCSEMPIQWGQIFPPKRSRGAGARCRVIQSSTVASAFVFRGSWRAARAFPCHHHQASDKSLPRPAYAGHPLARRICNSFVALRSLLANAQRLSNGSSTPVERTLNPKACVRTRARTVSKVSVTAPPKVHPFVWSFLESGSDVGVRPLSSQ